MNHSQTPFPASLTVFFLVKTSPEWLGFTFDSRLEKARGIIQPILDEFAGRVRLNWYDVEFYAARVTDIWMIEAIDHHGYQLFCEKLRETPFWDRYFMVKEILPGELNAWAKNYAVEALRS